MGAWTLARQRQERALPPFTRPRRPDVSLLHPSHQRVSVNIWRAHGSLNQQVILSIPLYSQKERVGPQPPAQRVFPFLYSSHGQKQECNKPFLSPL